MNNKPAFIVDLDGALADIGTRNPYDASTCSEDKVNEILRSTLHTLLAIWQDCELLIVTGRKEAFREQTENWLSQNKIAYDRLFMRTNEDTRSQTVLKEEILQGILKEYKPMLALEDSWRVAEMYRKNGIPCWQVNHDSYF